MNNSKKLLCPFAIAIISLNIGCGPSKPKREYKDHLPSQIPSRQSRRLQKPQKFVLTWEIHNPADPNDNFVQERLETTYLKNDFQVNGPLYLDPALPDTVEVKILDLPFQSVLLGRPLKADLKLDYKSCKGVRTILEIQGTDVSYEATNQGLHNIHFSMSGFSNLSDSQVHGIKADLKFELLGEDGNKETIVVHFTLISQ